MQLGRLKIAELIAVVGVVCGIIALFLTWTADQKYSNDGTFLAAELILLALAAGCLAASLLLGKVELDLIAAVAGAVAFGLFLFVPAASAFDHFGILKSGAWLGVCAGLIPLGAGTAQLWHRQSDAKAPGLNLWTLAAVVGLVLIVIGIWMKAEKGGTSYWDASFSGHALGLLLLILAIISAVLIAVAVNSKKAELADLAQIVSAILVGVAIAEGAKDAFGDFGVMGTGAWLELAGGLVLVLALIANRVVKLRSW